MTVTLSLFAGAGAQFLDNSGNVLTGGLIYTYSAGTTTPLATYTSNLGTSAHPNPIVLDAAGRIPGGEIWLSNGFGYKFITKDANNVLIGTYDNIPSSAQPPIVNDASSISYEQGNSTTAGAFKIGQTYLITSIGTTNFQTIGASANQVGILFTATGVGTGTGTAQFSRTVQAKLQESVSVSDFGALGDGTTDDTVAIQAALTSGAGIVNFIAGKTYLINGGLTVSTVGQAIVATGATIKLKNSATYKGMIRSNAAYVTFDGGTWDGNKTNGNSSGSLYDSIGISVYADNCTVKNIVSINTFGIGIKGAANYCSFLDNKITDTTGYGIFMDAAPLTDYYGNRAIGNFIDMSAGGTFGQGILFTAYGTIGTNFQIDWEISNNNIIGSQSLSTSQSICLGVRGKQGLVSNNTTRYGAMGWSEGGSGTVIDGNRFLDCVYASVELSGGNTIVSNNVITTTQADSYGILLSGNDNFDNIVISGNNITSPNKAISWQLGATGSAKNGVISGNYLKGASFIVVELFRDVSNITISGNNIVGGYPALNGGRGIYFGPFAAGAVNLNAFISGNTISNVEFAVALYQDGTVTTINNAYATGNNFALAGTGGGAWKWSIEGTGLTVGTNVIFANNVLASGEGLKSNFLDQANNLIFKYAGIGTPNGVITGSIGSIFINTAGGAGTTLYVKESGTNTNTGWVGK
jgi:hypothetical protein